MTDHNISDKISADLGNLSRSCQIRNWIISKAISRKVRTILFLFLMSFSLDPGSTLLPTSFASTSLSGDAFSNFFLSVLVEIPGYIFCIIVMDCWGRRPILSFCQVGWLS